MYHKQINIIIKNKIKWSTCTYVVGIDMADNLRFEEDSVHVEIQPLYYKVVVRLDRADMFDSQMDQTAYPSQYLANEPFEQNCLHFLSIK